MNWGLSSSKSELSVVEPTVEMSNRLLLILDCADFVSTGKGKGSTWDVVKEVESFTGYMGRSTVGTHRRKRRNESVNYRLGGFVSQPD